MQSVKDLFGKRIKELRKARNLTQEQLAELVDIDTRNIIKIENIWFNGFKNLVFQKKSSDTLNQKQLDKMRIIKANNRMNYIDEMIDSDDNKGILLYVDSPGGAVYQSDELYQKIMEYKKKTKRPVYAYFASEACSGGYYISMAADKIYANRNCWTGSIGVIVSLTNCKKLYDKLGIKEIDITSGKNKAMGAAGLDLTQEQRDILQGLVDEAYDQFVDIVSKGRNLDEAKVRELADGRIYSAKQAKENALVDVISTEAEAKKELTKNIGCDDDITFYSPDNDLNGFFNSLFGKIEKIMPKSNVELATDIVENNGNGVLKYYAK